MTKSSRRFVTSTFLVVLVLVVLYHQTSSRIPNPIQAFSRNLALPNQTPGDDKPTTEDLGDINNRIRAACVSHTPLSTPNQKRGQDDPCILDYIDNHFLLPPSPTKKYNLTQKSGNHATEFSEIIEEYFKKKSHGTFIEVGALDGEESSNTLFFERFYGWTGLLIECNPVTVSKLVSKNRRAWVAQACLSTTDEPETVNLMTLKEWPASAQLNKPLSDEEMTALRLNWVKDKHWYNYSLPAFPLYSIIMATRAFTEIDFLSLDVQGIELKVLKNFPFEKFKINYILAEIVLLSDTEKQEVKDLMASKGYKLLKAHQYDYSFVRELSATNLNG